MDVCGDKLVVGCCSVVWGKCDALDFGAHCWHNVIGVNDGMTVITLPFVMWHCVCCGKEVGDVVGKWLDHLSNIRPDRADMLISAIAAV